MPFEKLIVPLRKHHYFRRLRITGLIDVMAACNLSDDMLKVDFRFAQETSCEVEG